MDLGVLKVILIIQAFYGVAMTLLIYSMPVDALHYASDFGAVTTTMDLSNITNQVQGQITKQSKLPIIEFGALVFYSGNIIIDLFLNFAFAVPQMIGALLGGLAMLMSTDTYMWATIRIFSTVLIGVLYLIGVMSMLLTVRSGGRIT
jgi:hypothetical protein